MENAPTGRKAVVENNKIYFSTAYEDGKCVAELQVRFMWQMM
jgi:hypothetical protein